MDKRPVFCANIIGLPIKNGSSEHVNNPLNNPCKRGQLIGRPIREHNHKLINDRLPILLHF